MVVMESILRNGVVDAEFDHAYGSLGNNIEKIEAVRSIDEKKDDNSRDEKRRKRLSFNNFIYYYKWHIIIIVVILVIASVIIYQFASRVTPDVYIFHAGEDILIGDDIESFQNAFESVMSLDYDGKKGKQVIFSSYFALTSEQWSEYLRISQNSALGGYTDGRNRFLNEVQAGYSNLFILNYELFEESASRFADIAEIIDIEQLPDGVNITENGRGIVFSTTGFARNFSISSNLKEGVVICVKKPSVVSFLESEKDAKTRHDRAVQMLLDIINFEVQ